MRPLRVRNQTVFDLSARRSDGGGGSCECPVEAGEGKDVLVLSAMSKVKVIVWSRDSQVQTFLIVLIIGILARGSEDANVNEAVLRRREDDGACGFGGGRG